MQGFFFFLEFALLIAQWIQLLYKYMASLVVSSVHLVR
jgi:hypothetical protein